MGKNLEIKFMNEFVQVIDDNDSYVNLNSSQNTEDSNH